MAPVDAKRLECGVFSAAVPRLPSNFGPGRFMEILAPSAPSDPGAISTTDR
jgi:hypothetical protein